MIYSAPTGFEESAFHARTLGTGIVVYSYTVGALVSHELCLIKQSERTVLKISYF
jgi:hypothetical protein